MLVEGAGEHGLDALVRGLREAGSVEVAPIDSHVCAALFTDNVAVARVLAAFLTTGAQSAAAGGSWRRIAVHSTSARSIPLHSITVETVARCRHILDTGSDGQILASAAVVSHHIADDSGLRMHDLGVHRLRDLRPPEHLYQVTTATDQATTAVRSLSTLPNNLPVQLTSFVGHVSEQEIVEDLLDRYRLVTLTGQGGVGKTRLASQVAAGMIDRWRDGVWLADLGETNSQTGVLHAVAKALGVAINETHDPLETLTARLESAELLIVLDTCEPVRHDACMLAEQILATCPRVWLLCTSREPISARGEVVWVVPHMEESDAAALFTQRAEFARPGVSEELEADRVNELCARLDSLPLAIELAAAWVRTMSPSGILQGLDERFRLLTGGSWQSQRRHQAMRASVDWSYDLLEPGDQVLFRRLSVFRSSFSVAAAAAVCPDEPAETGEMFQALRRLADKSLVLPLSDEHGLRYRLLDTLREYGAGQLGQEESHDLRARHLAWCCQHAQACDQRLDEDQVHWIGVLNEDRDNFHAALEWGLDAGEAELVCRLAAALSKYWFFTGQSGHALAVLTRALELGHADPRLESRLVSGVALARMITSRFAAGMAAATRGVDVGSAHDDAVGQARCLAVSAYYQFYFDFTECERLSRSAMALGREAGDAFPTRLGELMLACSMTNRDRHADAVRVAKRLDETAVRYHDGYIGSFAQSVRQWAALFTGDVPRAIEFAAESLRRCQPLRDYMSIGTNTGNLAWALGLHGKLDDAFALMSSVVRSLEEVGDDAVVVSIDVVMGKLTLWAGRNQRARKWIERALRFDPTSYTNWVAARALPDMSTVLRESGELDEAYAMAMAGIDNGRTLETPHAVAESLDQLAVLTNGTDPSRAREHLIEALQIRVEHELRTFYVDSLRLLAANEASGEPEERVRLAAAAQAGRRAVGYLVQSPSEAERERELLDQLLRQLGEERFQRAWDEGSSMALDAAAAQVLRAHTRRRGRPSTGWKSLTPAEQRVAVLVAEGLTNPQIAARLFVSRTTVKTHVAHIFTKLGLCNRTQLAQMVTRGGHGIVQDA